MQFDEEVLDLINEECDKEGGEAEEKSVVMLAVGEVNVGGYPDNGNGLFSDQLSYKEWYNFQLAQRSASNFLENLPIYVFFILVAGLVFPGTTTIFGLAIIGLRCWYAKVCSEGHPTHRCLASKYLLACQFSLFILAFSSAVILTKATNL